MSGKKFGILRRKNKRAPRYSNRLSYGDLITLESKYGGAMFGPVEAGHRREFFKDKENVWIWYEGWTNPAGITQEIVIRYEVRPSGVFKRVGGEKYKKLSGAELDNFRNAARNYLKTMKTKLYY